MNHKPVSTSSAKDEKLKLSAILTAASFLVISVGAIIITITNWSWQ